MKHPNSKTAGLFRCGLILATTVLGLTGCARWKVIEQSRPSPLSEVKEIAIEWDFTATSLDSPSGAQNLRRAQRVDTRRDRRKDAIRGAYAKKLAAKMDSKVRVAATRDEAGPDAMTMRVKVDEIQEGIFIRTPGEPHRANTGSVPTRMEVRVRFETRGEITDEIAIRCFVAANSAQPAVVTRLSSCASILGKTTSKYLHTRIRS